MNETTMKVYIRLIQADGRILILLNLFIGLVATLVNMYLNDKKFSLLVFFAWITISLLGLMLAILIKRNSTSKTYDDKNQRNRFLLFNLKAKALLMALFFSYIICTLASIFTLPLFGFITFEYLFGANSYYILSLLSLAIYPFTYSKVVG